jgi:hypothetical protein
MDEINSNLKSSTLFFPSLLVFIGILILFFLLPHRVFGDGGVRFMLLYDLITTGTSTYVPSTPYSLVSTFLSLPLWIPGFLNSSFPLILQITAYYNFFIFCFGLLIFWLLLKNYLDKKTLLTFFLILIAASMFPNHLREYYAEVFSAVLIGVGIMAINVKHGFFGWTAIVLGTVNLGANILGVIFIVIQKMLWSRKLRYALIIPLIGFLALFESFIRLGTPFGLLHIYSYNGTGATILPFSGKPAYSYPLFFGILSVLFSFGKGLIFFTPGVFLPIKNQLDQLKPEIKSIYWMWLAALIGMIIISSQWWAWYGGWFWGPRYYIFASIPASFAIALCLKDRPKKLFFSLILLLVLVMSFWVGINGAVFDQWGIDQRCATDEWKNEYLCWYIPEFSALFYPFVKLKPLIFNDIVTIIYSLAVFFYLAKDLLVFIISSILKYLKDLKLFDFNSWKF